jgi:hypothetical protein
LQENHICVQLGAVLIQTHLEDGGVGEGQSSSAKTPIVQKSTRATQTKTKWPPDAQAISLNNNNNASPTDSERHCMANHNLASLPVPERTNQVWAAQERGYCPIFLEYFGGFVLSNQTSKTRYFSPAHRFGKEGNVDEAREKYIAIT